METSKITSKGQITLPRAIRKSLKLNEGDRVAFIEKDGKYELVNPNHLAVEKAKAMLLAELKKGEDSLKNEPTMTLEELKERLGI